MHPSFGSAGESPFEFGYAIVDPETPERVAQDAMRIRPEKRGMIQLSTTVDAWAPESQEYEIGRRCLEAILAQERWRVRILTKNSAVAKEYDLIERHRDRVLVGLSLTGTLAGADRVSAIEPNASSIPDRLATLRLAHQRGLRTYAMLCPLLPGIADSPGHIRELVSYAAEFGAEEIFVEPVNPRGPGLRLTADALRRHGFATEAAEVETIRKRRNWSAYTASLLRTVQSELRERGIVNRLRFLLYPSSLTSEDLNRIRHDDEGVRWLGDTDTRSKSLVPERETSESARNTNLRPHRSTSK
jgi:DNA repair photolyase